MMGDKIFQLILIVVAGVIVADFVAHAAGTTSLFNGLGMLFEIGTQPVNVGNIHTTPMAHTPTGKTGQA